MSLLRKGMVTRAGDETQVEVAKRRTAEAAKQADNDLLHLLSLPQGRRFLWRLLAHCRLYESPGIEADRVLYNVGRSDVGRYLLREIQTVNPKAYIAMQQEAHDRLEQLERDLNVLTDR